MSGIFDPLVVIPVFDHEHAIGDVVARVRGHGVPCLLVDDGSSPACAAVLDQLATQPGVSLLRLPVNQGKGGAVMAGLREAASWAWRVKIHTSLSQLGTNNSAHLISGADRHGRFVNNNG